MLDSTQVGTGRWRRDSTVYDAADRVVWTRAIGDSTSVTPATQSLGTIAIPAETLTVTTTYDAEGRVTVVTRVSAPDGAGIDTVTTLYAYDPAGRKVEELDEGTGTVHTVYDAAGHVVRMWESVLDVDHRGLDLTMDYDAAGQLVRRISIAMVYPVRTCTAFAPTGAGTPCYFVFPLTDAQMNAAPLTLPAGTPLRIDADTAEFRYDRAGRQVAADNAHARVRRAYSPAGLLLADTLRIRTLRYRTEGAPDVAADFSGHGYALAMGYDRLGRRTTLTHPDALDPCSGACAPQRYYYQALTGRLDSLVDVRGHSYRFTYTRAGQLDTLRSPGGVLETRQLDAEGQESLRRVGLSTGSPWLRDSLVRDAQGRVLTSVGKVARDGTDVTTQTRYAGLGAVTMLETNYQSGASDRLELFRTDANGNVWSTQRYNVTLGNTDNPAFRWNLYDTYGRLTLTETRADSIGFTDNRAQWYGAKGRLAFTGRVQADAGAGGPTRYTQEAHYYDGLGRLAVFERHVGDLQQPSWANETGAVIERYRYDALGRRVLVHTNRPSSCTAAGCDRSVRRQVWDGDQLLYEIKAPASDTTLSTTVESDTPGGSGLANVPNTFGRVAYVHAGGIDRPLGVIRLSGTNTVVVQFAPHLNWRGLYEFGTDLTGARITHAISWPGEVASAYLGATPSTTPDEWMGSLILEQADASGLLYRRNRYYDPGTGRFTQPDPIGLAGGLNLYGYADGDPINKSDPFGLTPCLAGPVAMRVCAAVATAAGGAIGAALAQVADNLSSGRSLGEGVGTAALEGARDGAAMALGAEFMGAAAGAASRGAAAPSSPRINPRDVAGKSPGEIDAFARSRGLTPVGPNPAAGRGAYRDPVTGCQRILCHPNATTPHAHVNNAAGQRLGIDGSVVPTASPAAHLPIRVP